MVAISCRPIVFCVPLFMIAIVAGSARAQLMTSEWNTGRGNWNVPASWLPVGVPDNGGGSSLRIEPHSVAGTAAFTTLNLDVNNGGSLTMVGGILNVSTLLENNSSIIGGFGVINVGDADGLEEQAFENSGTIQVLGTTATAGTLTLHASGLDSIDLDGDTEAGVVNVSNAAANLTLDTLKLIVDGRLADPFGGVGGTLQIGQRDTVTFK